MNIMLILVKIIFLKFEEKKLFFCFSKNKQRGK